MRRSRQTKETVRLEMSDSGIRVYEPDYRTAIDLIADFLSSITLATGNRYSLKRFRASDGKTSLAYAIYERHPGSATATVRVGWAVEFTPSTVRALERLPQRDPKRLRRQTRR